MVCGSLQDQQMALDFFLSIPMAFILMLIIALITAVALITPLPPGLAARCSPRILVSYIKKRNRKGLMILEDILFSLD
jgi:hypothetical protein